MLRNTPKKKPYEKISKFKGITTFRLTSRWTIITLLLYYNNIQKCEFCNEKLKYFGIIYFRLVGLLGFQESERVNHRSHFISQLFI